MHIPEPLSSFQKRTLLVVADGEHALFFSLHDREMEPSGEVSIEYPSKEDMERSSVITPGGRHSAEQSENLNSEKEHRFSHLLANELMHRLQQDQYEDLILTIPQEQQNEFVEALHNDVRSHLIKIIPKLLTNEPPIEILERI